LTRGTGIIFISLDYLARGATERDIIFIRLEYLTRGATGTGIICIN
jgi:hypothetical protein